MVPALRASIIVIGDEILGGFVQDTNSQWLAQRLQGLGLPLDRVTTVSDHPPDIGDALEAELARRRPRVVLTSGGIGSTPDDRTFEAVAATLGRELVTEPQIDAAIDRLVARSAAEGSRISEVHAASLRKMARVPAGAALLDGALGVAPGVSVDVDGGARDPGGATVVVLPGVPSELRRITLEGVEPALLAGRGSPQHVEELTHGYPESTLNPVLDRLVAEFPDVHVGSYPGRECLVRLKGAPHRVREAATLVEAYLNALQADPTADRMRERWQARWQPDARG
jgi:nicotinamide-nucleotide amidase